MSIFFFSLLCFFIHWWFQSLKLHYLYYYVESKIQNLCILYQNSIQIIHNHENLINHTLHYFNFFLRFILFHCFLLHFIIVTDYYVQSQGPFIKIICIIIVSQNDNLILKIVEIHYTFINLLYKSIQNYIFCWLALINQD